MNREEEMRKWVEENVTEEELKTVREGLEEYRKSLDVKYHTHIQKLSSEQLESILLAMDKFVTSEILKKIHDPSQDK